MAAIYFLFVRNVRVFVKSDAVTTACVQSSNRVTATQSVRMKDCVTVTVTVIKQTFLTHLLSVCAGKCSMRYDRHYIAKNFILARGMWDDWNGFKLEEEERIRLEAYDYYPHEKARLWNRDGTGTE